MTAAQSLSNPCCSSVLNQVTRVRVQLSATVATRTRCSHKFQKPPVPPLYCNPVWVFFMLRPTVLHLYWGVKLVQHPADAALQQTEPSPAPQTATRARPEEPWSPGNFLQDQCNSTLGPSWLPTIKDTRCCDDSHHIENIPVTLRKQQAVKPIFKINYFNILGQFRHRVFFFMFVPLTVAVGLHWYSDLKSPL